MKNTQGDHKDVPDSAPGKQQREQQMQKHGCEQLNGTSREFQRTIDIGAYCTLWSTEVE